MFAMITALILMVGVVLWIVLEQRWLKHQQRRHTRKV